MLFLFVVSISQHGGGGSGGGGGNKYDQVYKTTNNTLLSISKISTSHLKILKLLEKQSK